MKTEEILAIIVDLRNIEEGTEVPAIKDRDHRARAAQLRKLIEELVNDNYLLRERLRSKRVP